MKKIILLLFINLFIGCDGIPKNVKKALNVSGDNKEELLKVISHYKKEGNIEKLNAAYFLISNMPYHGHYIGEDMKTYESAYRIMSDEKKSNRYKKFAELEDSINYSKLGWTYDIWSVKSDYLIQNIDEAYDVWKNRLWSDDYDISYFYKYILPYRIREEYPTNWRLSCKNEVDNLLNTIWSERGIRYEAEFAYHNNCLISIEAQASNQHVVMLDSEKKSELIFSIDIPIESEYIFRYYYTSGYGKSTALLQINNNIIDTLSFAPTESWSSFQKVSASTKIKLHKGINKIKLTQDINKVGIDYMELAPVEKYPPENKYNFLGKLYRIKNKANNNYITFDTIQLNYDQIYKMKVHPSQHKGQNVRLVYVDFGYWRIESVIDDIEKNPCLDVLYTSVNKGANINRWIYNKGAFQKWSILPVDETYYKIISKDTGLSLESMTDSMTGDEMLIQNIYNDNDKQKWHFEEVKEDFDSITYDIIPGSAIDAASRICDKNVDFQWINFKGLISPNIIDLLEKKTGNCREEAAYILSLSRLLGIPAAIDFVPSWGNRSQGHLWNIIINPNGNFLPFYLGSKPGDTTNAFHNYKKCKVYRYQFEANVEYINNLKEGEEMPGLFRRVDYIDVSDEYLDVCDITVDVPERFKQRKFAYICVFNNTEWVPVDYGKINNGKVSFTKMGKDIAYVTAVYLNGVLQPFGDPIIIKDNGEVQDLSIKSENTTLTLYRKYPFLGKDDFFNYRMIGGKFQGSNYEDFSQVTELYSFYEITEGCWYENDINNNANFKYLRYVGPNGSWCNINELEFYDKAGKKLTGEIIGTEGWEGATIDNVFDDDILTGFNAKTPDGNWVGLKLRSPSSVGKIRFIPRNDGNCIEIGNEYELMYWDKEWHSLGRKFAENNYLIYENVPQGKLYLLHNLTNGTEERIFTYEKNMQIWW